MQNLLKSVFIALFPAFTLYALVDSIIQLTQNQFSYHALGQLISALTIVVFFAGLFIVSQARTKRHLNVYTIFIAVGLILAMIERFSNESYVSNYLVLLLVFGWVAYISWYSVFKKRDTTILKVGKQLPNFELEDSEKTKISSSSFLSNPSIFLFYRGNWCPLCMAQIKEIAAQYHELDKRGVNIILISPQPHKFSKSLAEKHHVNFKFLTDKDNVVAKQLGIFAKNGIPTGFQVMGYDSDTVLPTVIITDKKGNIVFADLTDNYRVRPEPETFWKVIDKLSFNS